MSGSFAKRAASSCLVLLALAGVATAQTKRSGAILPGGDPKEKVKIVGKQLDYFDKEQKLVYTGDVIATQGAPTLRCTVLTIFLTPKAANGSAAGGGSSGQVQHMVADGPVTMVQKDQVGAGDHAVYDKASDTVVMTGNVVLTQGPNVTKGDKLVYDLKSGHATVSGARVFGMFEMGDNSPLAKSGAETDTAPSKKTSRKSSR